MSENELVNQFDLAADAAEKELVSLLEGLDTSEKIGAMSVIRWQAKNYLAAGHKRLGRILVKLDKNSTK